MESITTYENTVTLEEQKRRSFMNNSSVHSFNHTEKKSRIIRVTNGRIFRNGKVWEKGWNDL